MNVNEKDEKEERNGRSRGSLDRHEGRTRESRTERQKQSVSADLTGEQGKGEQGKGDHSDQGSVGWV